ncbi:DUF262 domain-containing protein [Deinococcus alpinitundrae]|uniref:DUF262 domain-containing protein n=1 Tax=Deinococcus alpinitundrae TaxID=468913 RepID=UPI001379E8F6|nr:DUF262 domain-containing protein [Deinococcus alpinitundrae]
MPLQQEIDESARKIFTDSYKMSIGEFTSLYKDEEVDINPEFQRLFRWSSKHKTRFIESLLLGIPIPPIFVFTNEEGTWELIDGLQRVSTILEFMGVLRKPDGELYIASKLEATKLLPSLKDTTWDGEHSIGKALQISIRRARIRVEILKKESDTRGKFELFQRLNTGGINLEPQEIRNASMLMVSRDFYFWLKNMSEYPDFVITINQTEPAAKTQKPMELALRLLAYREVSYDGKLDANEYIDIAMINLIERGIQSSNYTDAFYSIFTLLNENFQENAFMRFDGRRFLGGFTLSAFETIAYSLLVNYSGWSLRTKENDHDLVDRVKSLWSNKTFNKYSGSGVRATQRLSKLLPLGAEFFAK